MVRVLVANGVEVVIPPRQGCCGAVTDHQGETDHTQPLARDLVAAFAKVTGPGKPAGAELLDAVLVAASGCGHALKQSSRILETDAHGRRRGSAAACRRLRKEDCRIGWSVQKPIWGPRWSLPCVCSSSSLVSRRPGYKTRLRGLAKNHWEVTMLAALTNFFLARKMARKK